MFLSFHYFGTLYFDVYLTSNITPYFSYLFQYGQATIFYLYFDTFHSNYIIYYSCSTASAYCKLKYITALSNTNLLYNVYSIMAKVL